jgi:single-strand selective monofunctional uracil DNA glycosylase
MIMRGRTASPASPLSPLVRISRELCRDVAALRFGPPVAYVYNPLEYARGPHEAYLERWGVQVPREVVMVGMNPGPFGMAQTGVPFGDVAMTRDFLGIEGVVRRPPREHPKRPVWGFACPRSEVSGSRLWGWARERFGSAERFFQRFYVTNWCPLLFLEASGRNLTPDKLPASWREPLFRACDRALVRVVETMRPRFVIGIGGFTEKRLREVLGAETSVEIGGILHPSPANPAANRHWSRLVDERLAALGIALDSGGHPDPA